MNFIDRFLNSITMYRLVLYGLGIMAGLALILSFFGFISVAPLPLIISGAVLLTVCFSFNFLLAKLSGQAMNLESADITALILFFIMAPPASWAEAGMVALAGALAMLSKYILAIKRKHIFNPAAAAVLIIGLLGSGLPIWWVATPALLPSSLILGLLVVRKIRRFPLFFSFLAAALLTLLAYGFLFGSSITETLLLAFKSYPLIFLGTIMLTEPMTTPPTRGWQMAYAAVVGVLFGAQFHVGPLYSTPELALVAGNIFAFIVSPKYKIKLALVSSRKLSADIYEFIFSTASKPLFKAGQYFEWTLPRFFLDSRGNRRYFTIASSPTENELRLGVRVMDQGSRFKKELVALKPGETMWAGSLSGDFTLPEDASQKLVFIAGGIGVTPFRSMVKYLIDRQERRDVVLIYSCLTAAHFVYKDIFKEAEAVGVKTHYLATDTDGYLTAELLAKAVPDFHERTYYLSGPNVMVGAYEKLLSAAGVDMKKIKTDYFPGF